MLTVDKNGWLKTDEVGDPEIRIVPSRRNGLLREPPCNPSSTPMEWPLGHVCHTTDLWVSMEKLARRIISDTPENDGASWNFGIARDGVIWQSVPLTLRSRHAAGGGLLEGRRVANVGRAAAGTELENAGRLRRDTGATVATTSYYAWPYYRENAGKPDRALGFDPALRMPAKDPYGQPYTAEPDGVGGWWCSFTAAQVTAFEHLVRTCSAWRPAGLSAEAQPPLGRASAWRYGHVDFAGSSGKEDPGKLWPAIRDVVLARVFPGAAPTAPLAGRVA